MFQTLIFVGFVGRDAELRYTSEGQAVTSFSVATNRMYQANGENKKETTWFRVSTWGKLAETCNKYVKKGMKVLVEGRLNPDPNTGGPRVWDSNGTSKSSFEVTAYTVRFLSSNNEGSVTETAVEVGGVLVEDDIPF